MPHLSERGAIPRIFLSYRRQDSSGHAGRLYDALAARFGESNVFMDVGTIDVGTDFEQAIHSAIESCDVLIALIGPKWLSATGQDGKRRLDDPRDYVRIELESALARKILVVPACVQEAEIPAPDDLPSTLAPFARRQGIELRDVAWREDVTRLIRQLAENHDVTAATEIVTPSAEPSERTPTRSPPKRRRALAILLAVAVVGSGVAALAAILSGSGGGTERQDSLAGATTSGGARKASKPVATKVTAAEVSFPAGKTARLGDFVYKILRARVDPSSGNQLGLRLTVRMLNNRSYGANFWDDSFRLLVNGVPRAPDSGLNELVAGRSAKEGTIEFVFPQNARSLVLVIGDDETARLPITLKPSPGRVPGAGATTSGGARKASKPVATKVTAAEVSFPAGKTARLGDFVYKILRARVDPSSGNQLGLRLTVRMLNNRSYGANFWDDSFRLLVNGVPRAPDSGLNELVAGRSAKEGTIEFVFPQNARSLVLVIGDDETARLPITLKPTRA